MAYFVLATIVVLFILLYKEVFRPSVLFSACLCLFLLLNLIDIESFCANYVNTSLLSLLLLLIIASIISRSELVNYVYSKLTPSKTCLFGLSVLSTVISAFVVNALVVSIAIKTLHNKDYCRKFLLPLGYITLLGGTCTLIGTSTNLIINGLVISYKLPPLDFFVFAYVGVPVVLVGLLYLTIVSPKILKENNHIDFSPGEDYFLEAKVLSQSSLIAKTVTQNKLRNLENIYLAEIIRNDTLIAPVHPQEIIYENDILIFIGDIKNVKDLNRFDGLEIFDQKDDILNQNLVWAVLSNTSILTGKTIKEVNFRSLFDAAVVAVRRGSEKLSGKIGSIILKPGDYLILATGDDFAKNDAVTRNFLVTSQVEINDKLSIKKSLILIALFITGIVLNIAGIITLFKVLILLLFIFLLLKFTDLNEIRKSFNLDLLILIGSALGVAQVLVNSGAAEIVSNLIIAVSSNFGIYGTFIGIYFLTLILTEAIHNNAAAALVFPIAYSTAIGYDVNPMPFIMAVVYGASASFITPYGHHVNLMIYNTGNYKPVDYFKLGLPLSIIYSILVLLLVPYFFKF